MSYLCRRPIKCYRPTRQPRDERTRHPLSGDWAAVGHALATPVARQPSREEVPGGFQPLTCTNEAAVISTASTALVRGSAAPNPPTDPGKRCPQHGQRGQAPARRNGFKPDQMNINIALTCTKLCAWADSNCRHPLEESDAELAPSRAPAALPATSVDRLEVGLLDDPGVAVTDRARHLRRPRAVLARCRDALTETDCR